jgi:hypothetical protein
MQVETVRKAQRNKKTESGNKKRIKYIRGERKKEMNSVTAAVVNETQSWK